MTSECNVETSGIFFQISVAFSGNLNFCNNFVPQLWVEFDNELNWLFTKRFRAFILFAENRLKNSVIPLLLTFIYLVALNLLVKNQLNSSYNSTHHSLFNLFFYQGVTYV